MQLVIDIDEKMYEDCKTRNTLHYSLYNFSSMIANGTPLPKGHGRLIEWLNSFDTNSATECFTAVNLLKQKMEEQK